MSRYLLSCVSFRLNLDEMVNVAELLSQDWLESQNPMLLVPIRINENKKTVLIDDLFTKNFMMRVLYSCCMTISNVGPLILRVSYSFEKVFPKEV